MSREDDLTRIEDDFRVLQTEVDNINQEYQVYHKQVADCVKGILEDAGLWGEIHGLEIDREAVRKKAEEKINSIKAKAQDLNKVWQYLKNLSLDHVPVAVPILLEYPVLDVPGAEEPPAPGAEETTHPSETEDEETPPVSEVVVVVAPAPKEIPVPVKTSRIHPLAPAFL